MRCDGGYRVCLVYAWSSHSATSINHIARSVGQCGAGREMADKALTTSQLRVFCSNSQAKGDTVALRQIEVITMPTEITSMTAVAIQPSARNQPLAANFPMMSGRHTIFIITNITGTATTPLSTALQ
ncbi:hypothetical protein ABH943_006278 [Caballeronia udeis]|uniref:Uncharacterized protein n=1 Tax=Caballeronia udeis TaxID=1232866 RepID=A0ABW8MV04_9BURK